MIIRVLIIYILILFVFRLMGKRQIGQMQPFEFVLTLIIADLATIPMAEIALPLLNGVVPMLTLVVFHYVITFLTRKSSAFSKMISGTPVIVVNPNGIDYTALKQLNITIDDLSESIRSAGYFSFAEIDYAIMETTGTVTVMPKPESSPATCGDLKIDKEPTSLPLTIICEGNFMEENLKLTQKTKEYFLKILKSKKINSIKNILLLTITKQGEIFFQEKNKPYKVFNVE